MEVGIHNEHVSLCGPTYLQSSLCFVVENTIPFANMSIFLACANGCFGGHS